LIFVFISMITYDSCCISIILKFNNAISKPPFQILLLCILHQTDKNISIYKSTPKIAGIFEVTVKFYLLTDLEHVNLQCIQKVNVTAG